jgi:hypothetical protein
MDLSSLFGSKYFFAADIVKPFVATVKFVESAEMRNDNGGTKERPVVHLDGMDKLIVLNTVRYDVLAILARSMDVED